MGLGLVFFGGGVGATGGGSTANFCRCALDFEAQSLILASQSLFLGPASLDFPVVEPTQTKVLDFGGAYPSHNVICARSYKGLSGFGFGQKPVVVYLGWLFRGLQPPLRPYFWLVCGAPG
jgi:hypothetical protein